MREAIFILVVVLLLLAFTAFRYRRQLMAGYQVWNMFQSVRKGTLGTSQGEARSDAAPMSGKLVSCSNCRTWVDESRALKLGRSTNYCSPECMEKAAVPT